MKFESAPDTRCVPVDYSGLWTAWNRDQTRIVGSGHTFEQAKRAAAAAGEQSIVLAKVPPLSSGRRVWRWSQVVAVFISLVPGIASALTEDERPESTPTVATVSTVSNEELTDSVDAEESELR